MCVFLCRRRGFLNSKNIWFKPCEEAEICVECLDEFSLITNVRGSAKDKAPKLPKPQTRSAEEKEEDPLDLSNQNDLTKKAWLTTWRRMLIKHGISIPAYVCCIARDCKSAATVGGHVWLLDPVTHCYNKDYCYIVPLCSLHNNSTYDYPFCFQVGSVQRRRHGDKTRKHKVLRIRPHELYSDYTVADSGRPTHEFIVKSFIHAKPLDT